MKTAASLRLRLLAFGSFTALSGAAGLAYQLVWARMFSPALGHELPATLAIVFAFLSGLALGAWLLDRPIQRSPNPLIFYAGLEFIIAVWGVTSSFLIPMVGAVTSDWIGLDPSPFRQWAISFLVPFLMLLPATVAMGATFTVMERCVSAATSHQPAVAAVYAANTFGGVLGTLAGPLVLLPAFGFRHTLWILAVTNAVCGAGAWIIGRHHEKSNLRDTPGMVSVSSGLTPSHLLFIAAVTGLLGIGLETVVLRVLSQVMENTIYSFAGILSVYLLGTAAGAALFQLSARQEPDSHTLPRLLSVLSYATIVSLLILRAGQPIYGFLRSVLGDLPVAVVLAEMMVAALVLTPATLLMGAIFSLLAQCYRNQCGRIGSIVAINIAVGALAAPVFGIFLIPVIGSKSSLILIALGYMVVIPKLLSHRRPVLAMVGISLTLMFPLVELRPAVKEGRIIAFHEGAMAAVSVVEYPTGHRLLRVNNRFQMGGTAAAAAQYRGAHIPLLLHPAPRRALFLGLGTGITFGAASLHPDLKADGIELIPEVIQALPAFAPANFNVWTNQNLKIHAADARRFVRSTTDQYDVIVADLFHPAMDGAGSLYTREHFVAIRHRLKPDGLFCQWLPLHQLDSTTLRLILRTFLDIFPDAEAWLLHLNVDAPVLGLIARQGPPPSAVNWIEPRINGLLEAELQKLAMADSVRFFGLRLADSRQLASFAGAGPLNTDDQPLVLLRAPAYSFRKNAKPYQSLEPWLQLPAPDFSLVFSSADSEMSRKATQQLVAYVSARNAYLQGLMADAEGRNAVAIERYLESARLSEDFTLGYAQCLSRASVLVQSRPGDAKSLLRRLVDAQPKRPVAAELLRRLETNR